MAGFTKQAIRNSCIKLLNQKAYHQLTVKDIVEDCGINRNSFYYHYQDLPSLIEEIITDEADKLIRNYSRIESIEEGLNTAISFALENKRAVLHIHNSANREMYEQYLWKICGHVAETYINTAFSEYNISDDNKRVIINFHKCECFGLIMDWLNSGMKKDIMQDLKILCDIRRGMTKEMFRRCEENSDKNK
ncbi:MAG: TetR/AcrR family transcriptional regulator [Ruminococcus flavefaciens]|nr:TetR/AcrR family transcriptional regulator [Ruminococcus flavefaciens]MCM1230316.1 TetR/AcrR family transcriptional regulator [Ruminococcus flavefaciens]